MIEDASEKIADWEDEDQVADYLTRLVRGEEFDGSGLIYGLGHAVYTKSDPRAVSIKKYAGKLAGEMAASASSTLLQNIERLGP